MSDRPSIGMLVPPPGEFAPGIPDRSRQELPRVTKPQTWEVTVQKHEAERAGTHLDLRLVDQDGRAHSWAIPKGKLPSPGEKLLVIPQPTHTREYAALKGKFTIPEGYGKGVVHAPGLVPAEVVEAGPDRVRFNVYWSRGEVQEYLIQKTGIGHLLHNVTTTKDSGIPQSKPKYKEVKRPEKLGFEDENVVHQPKLDGAHVTYLLRGGHPVRVFSYRPAERDTGVIEHTHKFHDWADHTVPKELDGTILRGELYATKDGRFLPAQTLGGLLNATVWHSRQRQKSIGAVLRRAVFDVVKYRGKDMEHAPYKDKLEALKQVQKLLPALHVPPTATTESEKKQLFDAIASGKHPLTDEGVIAWHLEKPTPTKFKFRPDYDAEVVGTVPGKGKFTGTVGALQVKLPGKRAVTHVGTGLSEALRKEIAANPENFIGRVAKIRTQQVFPSGKMRAPSFAGWHLEKGKQPMEKQAYSRTVLPAEGLLRWLKRGTPHAHRRIGYLMRRA